MGYLLLRKSGILCPKNKWNLPPIVLILYSIRQLLNVPNRADLTHVRFAVWKICNDAYRTEVILIHSPIIIGLSCVYLYTILYKIDRRAWFSGLNANINEVL